MRFQLVIDMDNGAFTEFGDELSRILRKLGHDMHSAGAETNPDYGRCYDTNGNHVGDWKTYTRSGRKVSR